jgi:hypothetical protein
MKQKLSENRVLREGAKHKPQASRIAYSGALVIREGATVIFGSSFDELWNLKEWCFFIFEYALISFFPDVPPKEIDDSCIFSLLLIVSCSSSCLDPISNAALLERDQGWMHIQVLSDFAPDCLREVALG